MWASVPCLRSALRVGAVTWPTRWLEEQKASPWGGGRGLRLTAPRDAVGPRRRRVLPRGMAVGAAPRVPSSGAPSLQCWPEGCPLCCPPWFSLSFLLWPHWVPLEARGLPMLLREGFSHCPTTCGISVPRPGVEPASSELEGGCLPTEPPGKSPNLVFLTLELSLHFLLDSWPFYLPLTEPCAGGGTYPPWDVLAGRPASFHSPPAVSTGATAGISGGRALLARGQALGTEPSSGHLGGRGSSCCIA